MVLFACVLCGVCTYYSFIYVKCALIFTPIGGGNGPNGNHFLNNCLDPTYKGDIGELL